jgi:hypothetical protein
VATSASRIGQDGKRGGTAAGLLLPCAVVALALPSAVLAFSSSIMVRPVAEPEVEAPTSALAAPRVDPQLAEAISLRMLPKGQGFHFTPAGTATRPDRSITVAVRVDSDSARAISLRKGLDSAPALSAATLRIAPTAFNLGVSRGGYQSFGSTAAVVPESRKLDMPDLSTFRLGSAKAGSGPSRFSTRLLVDEHEKTGRAPGTFETAGQPTVDLGGSYRVTGNLNVTAGVRYSADRDRIAPLTDGKQDSQAVYLGTQFRF